ncbi:MAG: D-alanyl-D-alanine carboxypeptidase, partial [Candidatus Neomarinimicrobiota bacterium]|nr:D-alanyl-D-alanine carboxypeptidase [Candidatus Neomarinimicrobiota bacterium]
MYMPSGSYNLSRSVNSIINGSEIKTNIAVKAVNLISGEILIDLNSHSLFNPASNNKLYTSISALGILDTNFTFNTSVYSDSKAIYLVGGGDPDLTLDQLDSLATITANKNPSGKRLVIDDSILDTLV